MTKEVAYAGTLESNDIYITLEKKSADYGIQIDLQSTVLAQFGNSIKNTILQTVANSGITIGLHLSANDKGALPCTIEARTKTVLYRAGLVKETFQ